MYLGLKAEHDRDFENKLHELMVGGMLQLWKAFPDHKVLQKMIGTVEKLFEINDVRVVEDGYKIRPTYHVTSMFIGGGKPKTESKIYQNFEVGKIVNVPVRALLFVPGKILTGVCFPDADVENRFPHMTLLLGKWPAKNSNMALEFTCSDSKQPFQSLYNYALSENKGGRDHASFLEDCLFEKKEKASAYFIVLEKPIVFESECHCYEQ